MIFDRGHLAYLKAIEKLNCMYCSYANGVIAAHDHYAAFFDYGDAEA